MRVGIIIILLILAGIFWKVSYEGQRRMELGLSDSSNSEAQRAEAEAKRKKEEEDKAVAQNLGMNEAQFAAFTKLRDARPSNTQITEDDYTKCRTAFEPCKGKYIRFAGVVSKRSDGGILGAASMRVAAKLHGFDVTLLDKKLPVPTDGSKVMFSGYVTEAHTYNDDVEKGLVEAVLMSPAEVQAEADQIEAEKERLAAQEKADKARAEAEAKAQEEANPTCKTRRQKCRDNEDSVRNFNGIGLLRFLCRRAANEAARYGEPEWTGYGVFTSFKTGSDFPKTGLVTLVDNNVKYQNAYGTYGKSQVVCIVNVDTLDLVDLKVSLR